MQPEARLGHQIRTALEAQGAFVFKVHGSGMMMAGLPDLIVCYQGRFFGVEVKMPGNKPSKIQRHVHRRIEQAGGVAVVVYSVREALTAVILHDTQKKSPS